MNGAISADEGGSIGRVEIVMTPRRSYLAAYTIAVWCSYLAVAVARPWSVEGWSPALAFSAVILLAACSGGVLLCLLLDRLLRRWDFRGFRQAAGLSFLLASAAAVIWSAISRLTLVAVLQRSIDPPLAAGNALVAHLNASASMFVFLSWICVWLAVTYAEDLRESRADAGSARDRITELESMLGKDRVHDADRGIDHIWVPTRRGSVRVPVENLLSLHSEGDYVRIITAEGTSFLVRATLRQFEQRLDAGRFKRLHRSTMVNVDRVTQVRREGVRAIIVLLQDGSRVKVGKNYAAAAKTLVART